MVLEIRLLGELEVARNGEPLTLPKSRKTLALLAYLAATGRRYRRDRLCSLLWELPDDPRGALRWSLSKVRVLVDDPEHKRIVADRENVALERDGAYIDILTVREACAKGVDDLPTARLQELAQTWRGDFLEGLELPDCRDFQAWCVAERDESRALHAKVLRALVGRFADDPEAALPHARALAAIAPDSDDVHSLVETLRTKSSDASAPLPLPDRPSIAVLPFDNLSNDPDQEYFADGIAEDIITGLSHMQGIFVIARNSSFTYKGQAVDVKRVGRELGVRYVLEGSVRRGGERVRVTAQLIEAQTGGHVWADRYDGTLEDVFALQDDITAKVLSAIGPEITLAEIQRARTERSDSVDAWDRYLQALPLFYALDKAGYEEATTLLRQAIEIDPRFSSAYAMLAQCHVHAGMHAWESSAREALSKAEEYARKAVALDQQDPFAHVALGWVHQVKTEQDRSVNELKRALELNPNLSIAYGRLSNALAFLGRPEEALAAAERANRGSPRDPERFVWFMGIMNAHFAAERYEECVEAAEQTILLQPNFYGAHFVSAMALPYLGRIEEAEKALRNALKLMPRLSLKNTARNPMFVREDDVARMLEGLRKAGLPE